MSNRPVHSAKSNRFESATRSQKGLIYLISLVWFWLMQKQLGDFLLIIYIYKEDNLEINPTARLSESVGSQENILRGK